VKKLTELKEFDMKKITMVATLLAFGLIQGCAHESAAEKALDKEIATKPGPKTQSDLYSDIDAEIKNSPTLSAEQKQKLTELGTQSRSRVQAIEDENLKLRSELFEEVLSKDYDRKEISAIHKKMKELALENVKLIFTTLESANKILGRPDAGNHEIMKHMDQFLQNRGDRAHGHR
jgi:Spy/CpxP family protein refolding chaperone